MPSAVAAEPAPVIAAKPTASRRGAAWTADTTPGASGGLRTTSNGMLGSSSPNLLRGVSADSLDRARMESKRGLNTVSKFHDPRRNLTLNKLWLFLDHPSSSNGAYVFSVVMLVLIILSTMSFVLETVKTLREGNGEQIFFAIEVCCITLFTLELIARTICCPDLLQFAKDPFNWIDVMAVVPFYIEIMLPDAEGASTLAVVRALRLVRIARVIKVSRYSTSIRIFSAAMISSVRPLSMLFFLVSIAMVLFSSGVYYAELTDDGCRHNGWRSAAGDYCVGDENWIRNDLNGNFTNPAGEYERCICDDKNPFTSVPATFWWCLVTMTTVGYGDEVPVTSMGRMVAVCTMISGIIILALPITVIGTNFARVLREIQHEQMLSELALMDKNEDGVIDKAELKHMLRALAGLSDAHGKKLVPSDVDKLLSQYDLDDNGVLDAGELGKLKQDLAERLGHDHPAYKQLVDSAQSLRKMTAPSQTAVVAPSSPKAEERAAEGDSKVDYRAAESDEELQVASVGRRSSKGSNDGVGGTRKAGLSSTSGVDIPESVQARLRLLESNLDTRLEAIAGLLTNMSQAIVKNESQKPVI